MNSADSSTGIVPGRRLTGNDTSTGNIRESSRRVRLRPHHISLATVGVLIAAWAVVTRLQLVSPVFMPSPLAVARKFIAVSVDGSSNATLLQHTLASLWRVFAALALAIVTAVPLGVLTGLNRTARAIADPLIEFYRPVPPLAYLPLIVIWCGIGEPSKILLIWLAIFAPLTIATQQGVRRVKASRLRGAQALGATRWQLVRYIIVPSAAPDVLTGIRISLGIGWSVLVAAELIAATRGLGFMIQSAAQFLETDVVVMGIVVIALIAAAFEWGLRRLQKALVPWEGHA
ncbi:ABC transporter permease subunit [Paraburkholderia gardini]|uniref:Aliphatic sulfonates transport permease protein SsuC n=1 Tax=Paraburkholderia gardini TaxID=2823469 RepID=A0ABM8TX83_9BURK|nr:ABC transporter permease subunit [Paraburkholderia gardini]CAG4885763.1 Putative aliphatic sulfonates transport permease protein SsuC [Paraburkholderia gardini]